MAGKITISGHISRVFPSFMLILLPLFPLLFSVQPLHAQAGTAEEPVRVEGNLTIDLIAHDGGMRPPVGACNFQTMRANRTHPELADGYGWTYNHAPMPAYWNNTFYQEYLSNPVDEHIAPGQTLLVTSEDGRRWTRPQVVFPPYEPPPDTPMPKGCDGYMMHQRMGFYVAPNDRLLLLAFYGHTEDPFRKNGIGRVVREAYRDGTFGPIYFIRYTSHADWNENNTSYPFYKHSDDAGFVEACELLLANKLMVLQWSDEDRGLDGFYTARHAGEALSFYHRHDGKVVGLWKWSLCALSEDEGASFSRAVKAPTLIMDGAKIWGQKTDDGRYALVYNPVKFSEHRYPLAVVTGNDGITFGDMLVVHGEVPPRRFFGRWKDYGPQYIRGIAEGNGNPPGNDLWLTYSVNKEDMWVSQVPVPIRSAVKGNVKDTFDDMVSDGDVTDWNLYCPLWATVAVVREGDGSNNILRLRDKDPYDYAKAVRVFEESKRVNIAFRLRANQEDTGALEVEILDQHGKRPVRLMLSDKGSIVANNGDELQECGAYKADAWHDVSFVVDCESGKYALSINGSTVLEQAAMAETVSSVERLSFRTGLYRDQPTRQTVNEEYHDPLPGADMPAPVAIFSVDDVTVASR